MGIWLVPLALIACQEPYTEVRGRYVRFRTTSEMPPCGGLVEQIDKIVEAGFAFLEEEVPAGFVFNYHWFPGEDMDMSPCDPSGKRACARMTDGEISVYSPDALTPHEIAHALHFSALPVSKRFLYEGFAMLFPLTGAYTEFMDWDETFDLDALVSEWDESFYVPAFMIVSWTVQRHGMSRFKEFWRSVEGEASAAEVRAAYEAVFGETIEAMIAAQDASFAYACTIPLCGDEAAIPWNGDGWSFSEPFVCEDEATIGPLTENSPLGVRLVYLDLPMAGLYRVEASGAEGSGVVLEACTASCPALNLLNFYNGRPDQGEFSAGRYKLALFRRYEPDDPPTTVEIEYIGPP